MRLPFTLTVITLYLYSEMGGGVESHCALKSFRRSETRERFNLGGICTSYYICTIEQWLAHLPGKHVMVRFPLAWTNNFLLFWLSQIKQFDTGYQSQCDFTRTWVRVRTFVPLTPGSFSYISYTSHTFTLYSYVYLLPLLLPFSLLPFTLYP